MGDIETVNRISNILQIKRVKLSVDSEKVISRTIPGQSADLKGFCTVVASLNAESNSPVAVNGKRDLTTSCLVFQWLEYAIGPASRAAHDKSFVQSVLKELNIHLSGCSYFVGQSLTVADLAIFFVIRPIMSNLSLQDKEVFINVSRWFNHLQLNPVIVQQGLQSINLSTLQLCGN